MSKLHYKTFPFSMKSQESDDSKIGEIDGYGSIFNNVDSYGDIVVKGAFAKSLAAAKQNQIKLLWQHDSSMPIGTWTNLKESDIGLSGTALLPLEIISIKEKYQMAKAGLVDGLSIGYMIRDGGSEMRGENLYLKDLDLREISLVTFPANPLALINDVKSNKSAFAPRDIEKILCGLGYDKKSAFSIVENYMHDRPLVGKQDEALIESLKKLSTMMRLN